MMEREVFTASFGIDVLWRVSHHVRQVKAVDIDGQTLIRQGDGNLRNVWFGEQLFESREAALAWVADEIERHLAEVAEVAAAIRREAEVPV